MIAAPAAPWRGVFSVHTRIAVKPTGAPRFTHYEVFGFGVANGASAVLIDRMGPDNYRFGARPRMLLDRRGAGVDQMIAQVRAGVENYPDPTVPGRAQQQYLPAHIPELGSTSPQNAVGKDFLPGGGLFAAARRGSGFRCRFMGSATSCSPSARVSR